MKITAVTLLLTAGVKLVRDGIDLIEAASKFLPADEAERLRTCVIWNIRNQICIAETSRDIPPLSRKPT